jgi:mannose-1-phosphate guanylyltransferase
MAGGVGSRFWPKSTAKNPKQFLDVLGIGKSLLRLTFERMQKISPNENIYILTNENYLQLVLSQLPELTEDQVICEPRRKNTAPCIAYASAKIYSKNKDAVLVITPSDHLILDASRFTELIQISIETALNEDKIVTLGILPTRPDTGYGYIEFDQQESRKAGSVNKVLKFQEKPSLDIAQSFLDAGNYYWNAGIFVWKASVILQAFEQFQPTLFELFANDLAKYGSHLEKSMIADAFEKCEDISIDFAILEYAKNIAVVLADFDWSDLGTWGSLNTHLSKDENNNAVVGINAHLFNSSNSFEDNSSAIVLYDIAKNARP